MCDFCHITGHCTKVPYISSYYNYPVAVHLCSTCKDKVNRAGGVKRYLEQEAKKNGKKCL